MSGPQDREEGLGPRPRPRTIVTYPRDARQSETRARKAGPPMTSVDPDDDSINRWVAFHYRYDPNWRERRNVNLAAFDSKAEFEAFLHQQGAELQAAKDRGEAEDVEHLGGVRRPAGYLAEVAKTRRRMQERDCPDAHGRRCQNRPALEASLQSPPPRLCAPRLRALALPVRSASRWTHCQRRRPASRHCIGITDPRNEPKRSAELCPRCCLDGPPWIPTL